MYKLHKCRIYSRADIGLDCIDVCNEVALECIYKYLAVPFTIIWFQIGKVNII